jgi:hypothetical protein
MSHSAHTAAPLHHFHTDVTQYTHSCTIALFPHRCHTVHTQLHHCTISPYNKILLTAENKDDMAELIKCVKHNSEKAGTTLNIKKTTVISTVEKVNIISDGEDTSTVTYCM